MKPSWMSIRRSAVLFCCVEEDMFVVWDDRCKDEGFKDISKPYIHNT